MLLQHQKLTDGLHLRGPAKPIVSETYKFDQRLNIALHGIGERSYKAKLHQPQDLTRPLRIMKSDMALDSGGDSGLGSYPAILLHTPTNSD